jgi:hypothetical protein
VKNDTYKEPALEQRLEVFRRLLPTAGTKGTRETGAAFRDLSWFCVLLGMNFKFDVPTVSEGVLAAAEAIAREKKKKVRELMTQVPGHWTHLSGAIYKRGG